MLQIPRVLQPIAVDCDNPKATKNSHYNHDKDFYIALLTALLQEAT